jgi:2,3-dihydroxybenzoate-AMP ligase
MTHAHREPDPRAVAYPVEFEEKYLKSGVWTRTTIAEHFHEIAQRFADHSAVVFGSEQLTFAELDVLSDQRATGLHRLGLEAGSAVLLQVHNSLRTVVAWYALLKAGLIPVCTLPAHRRHEITEIGRQTGAVAHLVDTDNPGFDLLEFASSLANESGISRMVLATGMTQEGSAGSTVTHFDTLGADIDPETARRTVAGIQDGLGVQSIAVFQLSGGTTGTPKVIPCLQAAYWAYISQFARAMGWRAEDRVAYLGPIVHNAGTIIGLQGPHSVGATTVLGVPKLDDLFQLVQQHCPTALPLGPFAYDAVFDSRLYASNSVRQVLFWGRKVPPSNFNALQERGVWAGQVFGMSEGLCMTTPLSYPPGARLGGVGVPICDLDEVRILGPATEREVAPGETGEMCARGPYTIRGYLGATEHNRKAFTSDGFYRSGDLMAKRIINGVPCYSVEGRIKDMISRGGEKINTEEVEYLLVAHERIAEAAVVAMPDRRLGERACAFVVGDSAHPVDIDEVRRHLEALGVAKYKWPERIVWLDEMPRASLVGKIDRKQLRLMAEQLAVG